MHDQCIGEIGSGPLPLVVTLREHLGMRFVELRLCKRSANSSRLQPTEWAVGIDASSFNELKSILDESQEQIRGWLGIRELDVADKVRADMAAQTAASQRAARTPPS